MNYRHRCCVERTTKTFSCRRCAKRDTGRCRKNTTFLSHRIVYIPDILLPTSTIVEIIACCYEYERRSLRCYVATGCNAFSEDIAIGAVEVGRRPRSNRSDETSVLAGSRDSRERRDVAARAALDLLRDDVGFYYYGVSQRRDESLPSTFDRIARILRERRTLETAVAGRVRSFVCRKLGRVGRPFRERFGGERGNSVSRKHIHRCRSASFG